MLILWRTVLLAATWLFLEFAISWAAFCQNQDEYGSAGQAAESYECIFRGPAASAARWFSGWWVHTFDKADAYVALFTAVLATGTLFLWWFTRKLWNVTRIAAEHIPRVERAYVHGGPGVASMVQGAAVPTIRVTITVNNYGKTPAFVNYICWDVYAASAPPRAPNFNNNRNFVGMFLRSGDVYGSPVTLTFTTPSILHLLIEYEDMFGEAHETGLTYRIFPRPQGYNEPVEGAYRRWT